MTRRQQIHRISAVVSIGLLALAGIFAAAIVSNHRDSNRSVAAQSPVFLDFQRFVSDSQAATYYPKWVNSNPNDSLRWFSFRDGILSGQTPAIPVMTSKYGAALVDAGQEYEDSLIGVPTTTSSTTTGSTTTAQTTTQGTTTTPTTTAQTTTVAANCSTVVGSVAAAQSAVASASGGSVICISPGTYGSFSFSGTHPSNVTFTSTGGKVVTGNINLNGTFLTVQNLTVNGGVFLNYPANNDKILYNDISNPGGFGIGIDGGLGANPVPTQPGVHDIGITGNKIHNNCNTGAIAQCEGDAFHISGWGKINITYNEVYGTVQNSAPNALHTDVLQSYQAGFTTGDGLLFDHNYVHDNNTEGFFLKDGAVKNVTYTQNLGLRNPSDGHPLDVYDTYPFVVKNNTNWAGSLAVLEGSGTLTFDHNVWDDFENAGNNWVVTKNNNIYGSQPFTSPFSSLSSGESVNSNPGFVNTSVDDYRLANNPNGLGINWKPSDYVYGPR